MWGCFEHASLTCLCRVNSAKRLRRLFEQIDVDHDGKFNATDFRFFLHKSSTRLEKMTQVSMETLEGMSSQVVNVSAICYLFLDQLV